MADNEEARPLGLFCVVEFIEGPQIIPSNWLDDKRQYCFWPAWANTIDQTRYDKNVKLRPVPEEDWVQEEVIKIRAHGDDFSRIRAKLKEAEEVSETDLNTSCTEGAGKLPKKRHIKEIKRLGDSSSEEEPAKRVKRSFFASSDDKMVSKSARTSLAAVTSAKVPVPPIGSIPSTSGSTPIRTSPRKHSRLMSSKNLTDRRTSPRKPSGGSMPSKNPTDRRTSPRKPSGGSMPSKNLTERRTSPRKPSGGSMPSENLTERRTSPRKPSGGSMPSKNLADRRTPPRKHPGSASSQALFTDERTSPSPRPPIDDERTSRTPEEKQTQGGRPSSSTANRSAQDDLSTMDDLNDRDFKRVTLINLKSIRLQLLNLPKEVAKYVAQTTGGNGPRPSLLLDRDDDDGVLDGLPASSDDELKQFDAKLKSKEFAGKVVSALQQIYGSTMANFIRAMLVRVVGNEVAQEYSFVGGKGKKRFDSLRFKKILFRAVRADERFQTVKDKLITDVVAKWLANAKARVAVSRKTREKDALDKDNSEESDQDDPEDVDDGDDGDDESDK